MSDLNENIITEEATENEAPEETSAEETIKEETAESEITPIPEENAKKKSKPPLIIALCVIVALVVGGLAFAFGSGGDGVFDPIFYTGEDGLYMKDLGAGKKDGKKVLEYDTVSTYVGNIQINSALTEALFSVYEDAAAENEISYDFSTLYSYNLTTPNAAPVKIVENVYDYIKDETTNTLTCIIGEESNLVQFDADLNTIFTADDIDSYYISADGLSILYYTNEGGTYLKQNGKDAVEISKKGTVEYYDDNFTLYYILEEGSLYKMPLSGEKTLIDKDVVSTYFVGDFCYYYKSADTINIKELFDDDMAEADNEIKIPSETDAEAYKLYTDRVSRDEIRTVINNPEANYEIQDLYCYDGTECKSILKNVYGDEFSYYYASAIESDIPSLTCSVIDTSKIKKVRMSELWETVNSEESTLLGGAEDVVDLIAEALVESCTDYFVYKGDYAVEINLRDVIHSCTLDEKNNVLYISVSDSVFGKAALYKAPLIDNKLGEAELICESVNSFETEVTEDGKLYYIEEYYPDEEAFDSICKVYFDGELIAENVYNVAEKDLERGIFLIEKYKSDENGELLLEEYVFDTVLYNVETKTEVAFTGESYFSLYTTPAGKTLIEEESYDYENPVTTFYLVENGTKKELFTTDSNVEFYSFMSEYRFGSGYIDWDDDDWGEDSFLDDGTDIFL